MERVKPETQSKVIEALKELVKQAGNVTAFAKSIDVSRDSVNNWLSGKSDIRLNDLVRIAEKYNVSSDWLLGLSSARTRDRSIEGAVSVTGLSVGSVCFLHDLSGRKESEAIDLLLRETAENLEFWRRMQAYLFTPERGGFKLHLETGEFTMESKDVLNGLLALNNTYLDSLRKKILGGKDNGEH